MSRSRKASVPARTIAAAVIVVAALLMAVVAGGCATIATTASGVLEPYAGLDLDAYVIGRTESGWERAARIVDVPLSLVADTILLPFTYTLAPDTTFVRAD